MSIDVSKRGRLAAGGGGAHTRRDVRDCAVRSGGIRNALTALAAGAIVVGALGCERHNDVTYEDDDSDIERQKVAEVEVYGLWEEVGQLGSETPTEEPRAAEPSKEGEQATAEGEPSDRARADAGVEGTSGEVGAVRGDSEGGAVETVGGSVTGEATESVEGEPTESVEFEEEFDEYGFPTGGAVESTEYDVRAVRGELTQEEMAEEEMGSTATGVSEGLVEDEGEVEEEIREYSPAPMSLLFGAGSQQLGYWSEEQLADVLQTVQENPGTRIEIICYSYGEDVPETNQIAWERANALADWLVERGVDENRISTTNGGPDDTTQIEIRLE